MRSERHVRVTTTTGLSELLQRLRRGAIYASGRCPTAVACSKTSSLTREWLKVKIRHEGRFVVVGLDVPASGSCALLLAARVGRRLVYVGRCEWGVSRRIVAAIRDRCKQTRAPACDNPEHARHVIWIEPKTTVEVQYNEMMQGWLRNAVLRGVETSRARLQALSIVTQKQSETFPRSRVDRE